MNIRSGIAVCLPVLLWLCPAGRAATYHLEQQGWQNISEAPQGERLLEMSKIKQQLLSGSTDEVFDALERLKSDFPEITPEEVDAYAKAEKLYAANNWYKAATEYTNFLDTWPDSLLQPAAMERIYSIATAFLQGQKRALLKFFRIPAFDDGVDLMNKLADRAGSAPIGLRALTTLAENQEKRNKMLDAYHTWAEIADRWPTGETGRKALLRMAQALHAAYGGPEYDASVLTSSRSYYEDFVSRYAAAAQDMEISAVLEMIKEQLAYKDYSVGFYYERTGKPDAAAIYYNRLLKEWPDTKAAQMAQARLAPDAPPAVKMTVRRRAVNLTTTFLDTWFGLQRLLEAVLPPAPAEPGVNEKVMDIETVNTRESM